MCLPAVPAPVPVDAPERAAGLRADGAAAAASHRGVAGQAGNQLLPEQRRQERSPGEAEEEEQAGRPAGKTLDPDSPAASPGGGQTVSLSLQAEERTWDFTQRQTEEEIQMRKKRKTGSVTQKHLEKTRLIQQKSQSNVSLLAKIFNSSVAD